MVINLQYKRTAPDGRTIIVTPKSQAQLEYYRDLEKHGYSYESVVTVHQSESTCISCEG